MNLGLTTSFIIGGLLMVLIVTMNVRMGQHSANVTLHGISQTSNENIVKVLKHDYSKIGYNSLGPVDQPISIAEKSRIVFESNLFNHSDQSTQTVQWILSDDPIATSKNSRHRSLLRIIDTDTTNITLGVTAFEMNFYPANSTAPFSFPLSADNRNEISRIEVVVETQPKEGIGRDDYYTTSSWNKIITPPNLNLTSQ